MLDDAGQNAGRGIGFLALFTSLSTLFCCALPIAFVTLGFGASWAAVYSAVPVIGLIAENKTWFFIGSGILIFLAAGITFRPGQTCPADPKLARLCERARMWNRRLVYFSAAIWVTGITAAYLSVQLLKLME